MTSKKTAKKATAKKVTAKKATAKKATAKKATAKKATAKKATAKKAKAKKTVSISEQELLARTLRAISEVRPGTWTGLEAARVTDEVVAAMTACVEAGRAELACQLAEAVPTPQRGRAQVSLALAGHLDPEIAVDALQVGLSQLDGGAACAAAAFALRAARQLERLEGVKRAGELITASDAAVDASFEEVHDSSLDEVMRAYLDLGEVERVKSMLTKVEGELPRSLAAGLWVLRSPEAIAERITRSNAHEAFASPALDLEGWSVEQIAEVADVAMGSWARPHFGEALVASGRLEDARTLVQGDPQWESLMPTWQVQRYLLLGDREAARTILEGPVPTNEFDTWAEMQRDFGIRGFAELWPLAAKRQPEASVMATIGRIIPQIEAELDAGAPTTEVADAFAVVESLLAGRFRTNYDRGVEGSTRIKVASLRARIQIAHGDQALAEAELEADWKGIASLLAYAKDAYARTLLLQGFAGRAAKIGRPDIGLKAGKKIPKSRRSEHAASIARSFLPGAPGQALAALDALAKDDAAKRLLDGRGLLAELWSAVLGRSALAA